MKKIIKYLLVVFLLSVAVCSNAQSLCTFTTCQPFQNNDARQTYGVLKQILAGILAPAPPVSGTVYVSNQWRQSQKDTVAFLQTILLNSTANWVQQIFATTYPTWKGIDTINQTLRHPANTTVAISGTANVNVTNTTLATSTLQTAGNNTLVSINTKIASTNTILTAIGNNLDQLVTTTSGRLTSDIIEQLDSISFKNTLKFDTTNQTLRQINLPIASAVTFTFFTGASAVAIQTAFNAWKTANPTKTPLRTAFIAPNVATREMYLEFK